MSSASPHTEQLRDARGVVSLRRHPLRLTVTAGPDRKLVRDLVRIWPQALAIALFYAIGTGIGPVVAPQWRSTSRRLRPVISSMTMK